MSGEGADSIGRFLIKGRYDASTLECYWTKSYLGAHDVFYRGFREGKGIWGTWEISLFAHGGFQIWPRNAGAGEHETEAKEMEEAADAIGVYTPEVPGASDRISDFSSRGGFSLLFPLHVHRRSDIIDEHVFLAMLAQVHRRLFQVAFEERISGNNRMAELADEEPVLRRVLSFTTVVPASRADIGHEAQAAALLEAHLAGAFLLRQQTAVFAASSEYVTGDGSRPHFQRANAGAPVPVEAVTGHVPGIASHEVKSIAMVPFNSIGGEHDG